MKYIVTVTVEVYASSQGDALTIVEKRVTAGVAETNPARVIDAKVTHVKDTK